jgi:tRNA(fMet)-specific endonuclease VapC
MLPILPYQEKVAHWLASERARLVNSGKTSPFVDGQITGIAKVNDLVLVTQNLSGFEYFTELQLTDWKA